MNSFASDSSVVSGKNILLSFLLMIHLIYYIFLSGSRYGFIICTKNTNFIKDHLLFIHIQFWVETGDCFLGQKWQNLNRIIPPFHKKWLHFS